MSGSPPSAAESARALLRRQLLLQRDVFVADLEVAASAALDHHLAEVLGDLMPRCLGGYWPIRSEFNPWTVLDGHKALRQLTRALPWASRQPRAMHYRLWNGAAPPVLDECGIPSTRGAEVVPDVILVPCIGYTREGWRLGYGGGYFDRYLAEHREAVTIGVAWSCGEIPVEAFVPRLHDRPLSLIVTERELIGR